MSAWPKILLILVTGYLTMSRSFAYIGVPQAKLFVGELAIAAFLLTRPSAVFNRWIGAMSQPTPLGGFSLAMACFVGYGWLELARGLTKGYPAILSLQGFAFHYYPICFFIGLWAGGADPGLLRRTVRTLAWVNGLYGLLYIAFLNRFPFPFPGTVDVPLFGQPAGSAIALLGVLCVEPKLSRVWHLLALNFFVMLGLQVRAEFLGFLLGAVLWSILTRRLDRLFGGIVAVTALLAVAYVADISAPAPSTRGGEISTREIVGRVVAPFDSDLAQELEPSAHAKSQAGTAEWRVRWWSRIWDEVHSDVETAFLGEGYGYPIASLIGYKERDIRTPHSIFFYCLTYGGWMGVVVFAALQFTLARMLWRVWRVTGNPFGPVIWLAFLAGACFGNLFETPFGAIPFYLLIGVSAAPLNAEVVRYANPASAHILQTAGR